MDSTATQTPHDDASGADADRPTGIPARGWREIVRRVLAEVKADRVPMMASAVAFAGLLALFPAMIAAISIYGLVVDPAQAARHAGELTAALPDAAAGLIGGQLESLATTRDGALGVALLTSVLGALWSASGGTSMLIDALNVAYDEDEGRGFLRKRGLALLLTLGAILFLALSLVLIAVVPAVIEGVGLGLVGTIAAQVARWVLLGALIAAALAVLYRLAPDREDARWSWLSLGSVVAGVLWLVGSMAFSVFADNFGSYDETYGTIAGVIVLMLWLQLTALIVLLGAELNAEAEKQTAVDTTTGRPKPMGRRGAEAADTSPPGSPSARTAQPAPHPADHQG